MKTVDRSLIHADIASKKFLTVGLAGEGYGIPLAKVREIIRYQKVTPVPQLPSHIRGVINLRGRIIPVLDPRTQFGLTPGVSERTCIVVVTIPLPSAPLAQVGLMVDSVDEVAAVAASDIEPAPDFGGTTRPEYLLGVAKIKGEVRMLLDIDRVFDVPTLSAAGEATESST